MKNGMKAISVASLCFNLALYALLLVVSSLTLLAWGSWTISRGALPQLNNGILETRQSIDFKLVDSTPDPTIQPGDTSNFNPSAAIASVIAAISASPLPQSKRSLEARDIVVNTYDGYTVNTPIGNASIDAPLDCNNHNTYMGAKLFTSTAFDTALCAAACSAQSAYNLRHPPPNSPAQTCQFYNTYAMYKNDVYQGQYCTLYNQTWNATYATNTGQYRGNDHYTIQYSYTASNATNLGQCPQAVTKQPLDLTATAFFHEDPPNTFIIAEKNLVSINLSPAFADKSLATRIDFPVIANEIYEISFDYLQPASSVNGDHYFIEVGDDGYEASLYWEQSQPAGTPTIGTSYYSQALSDDTGAKMDACWKTKLLPQTAPAPGVWNSGKVILKPRIDSGYFRWDYSYSGPSSGHTLQWKNVYVTKMPANYCD
ncbi:MAG: hypothetical protein Q9195_007154 [Heterodermia aff. obscurata]